MKRETKSSELVDKLINKGNISESLKVVASIDATLKKNFYPESKRVEKLSEQESRRKFKEKMNKLKKMPMPPEIINVTNEGLTEGQLTVGNMKRKCKQMMNKLKDCLPSTTTDYEKNQPQIIRTLGTKPIDSAVYKFGCILPPFKRSISGGGKAIESMISKSLGLLSEQINNQRIVLMSTDKDKSGNINPPSKSGDEKPGIIPTPEPETPKKVLEAKDTLKPLESQDVISEPEFNKKILAAKDTLKPLESQDAPTTEPEINKKILGTKDTLKPLESQDAPKPESQLNINKTYELTTSKDRFLKDITAMNNTAIKDLEVMAPLNKNVEDIVLPKIKEPEKSSEPAKSIDPVKPAEPAELAKSFDPVKPAESAELAKSFDPLPPKKIIPTIDLAPDHAKAKAPTIHPTEPNKPLELVTKAPFAETAEQPAIKELEPIKKITKARVGFFAGILKNVSAYSKSIKEISSTLLNGRKEPPPKRKMLPPLCTKNKIPFKWAQGVIMVGLFIPLFYSYHRIFLENKQLTLKLSEEN